eukprot:EG_transcript_30309
MALPWTLEEAQQEAVNKFALVDFFQKNAIPDFLAVNGLKGNGRELAKKVKKEQLVVWYAECLNSPSLLVSAGPADPAAAKPKAWKKTVLAKGNKTMFPKVGSQVKVSYTGWLPGAGPDGTDKQFDSSNNGKKDTPIVFNVGRGNVIQGWDEALLEMSVGEKALLVIEPEAAYGKKGKEPVIPPNATLKFELTLVAVLS